MVMPNSNELAIAWQALSSLDEKDGWRSIPLSVSRGVSLRAGRLYPTNVEALLIGFDQLTLPSERSLPKGKGFRIDKLALESGSTRWLALVRESVASLELFAMVAEDIVSVVASAYEASESAIFRLVMARISAWQEFMKRGGDGLSPEEELGLVGELVCLEQLLLTSLPASTVLDAWQGPLDGLQDFSLGTGAIEVKSTLAAEGFTARIMSLEQLDDSLRQPIFVFACRLGVASEGLSLPQRVAYLRGQLANDPAALCRFETALLGVGYFDRHHERYAREFVCLQARWLPVVDGFPRLTMGMVPVGVRSATYEIDLDLMDGSGVSIDEVLNLLGMV